MLLLYLTTIISIASTDQYSCFWEPTDPITEIIWYAYFSHVMLHNILLVIFKAVLAEKTI